MSSRRLATSCGLWLAWALAGCARDPEPVDASERRGDISGEPRASSGAASGGEPGADPRSPPSDTSRTRAASETASAPAERARIGAADVALRDCRLEVTWGDGRRQEMPLDLPGDCTFVKTRSGVQIEDTPSGKTALVVSSRPLEGRPGDCDTRVRAVVITGERAAVSKDQQTLRMCGAEGPFDTLMFHVLASSGQPLP